MVIQNIGFNVGGGGICSLVLFVGLFATSVTAIPVQMSVVGTVKYPIHVACECMFTLYVDGKYVAEGNKANYVPYGLITEWNDTKKYYPVIYENDPKIVAFHGVGGQYPAFQNGFIMDMNHGKDYTKYNEWKCKDFSKTANKVAPENWFAHDYDDSGWATAASFGANYQNNSFQIFENPRDSISLNAEWLWTKDNTVSNVYCRKKNENIGTIPVSQTIHALPPPVQTSAPHIVQTSAPHIVQTSAPPPVQTSAPPPVQTSAPHIVQTSAPHIVQTSAPPPVQTSAPHIVQTSAPPPVQTLAPPPPPPPPVPTIVISPHIQIVIQNIKYSQRRSNAHLDNLFRRIKLYNDEYKLYKQLTIARLHIKRHYKALYYDIKHVLEKHDTYDSIPTDDKSYNKKTVKNIPHFIRSMHTLNASIKKIEQSIQFIKGNHKYILLRILNKLKIQYQEDTQKLFEIIENM
jgi:hypothetical protein